MDPASSTSMFVGGCIVNAVNAVNADNADNADATPTKSTAEDPHVLESSQEAPVAGACTLIHRHCHRSFR